MKYSALGSGHRIAVLCSLKQSDAPALIFGSGLTGAVPQAQVAVAVGSWSAALGYADDSGNFSISGYAYPGNVGTPMKYGRWAGLWSTRALAVTVLP